MKPSKWRPMGMSKLGAGGFGAYSIGFMLAVPIVVCLLAGQWLDRRLGTSYWTIVLFVVGVVVGMREMLRAAAEVSRMSAARQAEEAEARRESAQTDNGGQSRPAIVFATASGKPAATEDGEDKRQRPRLFTIPEPPRASFERAAPESEQVAESGEDELKENEEAVRGDVLRAWLPDDDREDRPQN